jgi:hypothetical protein
MHTLSIFKATIIALGAVSVIAAPASSYFEQLKAVMNKLWSGHRDSSFSGISDLGDIYWAPVFDSESPGEVEALKNPLPFPPDPLRHDLQFALALVMPVTFAYEQNHDSLENAFFIPDHELDFSIPSSSPQFVQLWNKGGKLYQSRSAEEPHEHSHERNWGKPEYSSYDPIRKIHTSIFKPVWALRIRKKDRHYLFFPKDTSSCPPMAPKPDMSEYFKPKYIPTIS